jgi:hypothetical protein
MNTHPKTNGTATRLLRKQGSVHLLPYTEALARRPDMEEVFPGVPEPVPEPAAVVSEPSPDETVGDAQRRKIEAFTDKAKLEQHGRSLGVELDRRRSIANMQRDLIDALGLDD